MEITAVELKEKIKNGEKMVIDFWAPWCGPCKVLKPVFERISEEYTNEDSDVKLYTVNVEENREFAASMGIRSIPTIKSFAGGKEVKNKIGLLQEGQIKEMVNDLING